MSTHCKPPLAAELAPAGTSLVAWVACSLLLTHRTTGPGFSVEKTNTSIAHVDISARHLSGKGT